MIKLKIDGTYSVDGTYEIDETALTHREWHALKQLAGLTPEGLQEALKKNDPDVMVGLAMVALMRSDRIQTPATPWLSPEVNAIWNLPVGGIDIVDDVEQEVAAADPPASGVEETPNENGSGETTSDDSGLQAFARLSTGARD